MSIYEIKSFNNIDVLLENSNWEIDTEAEFPVFKSIPMIKFSLQNQNCFVHCFRETIYAISCVRYYDNKLSIEKFEVNKRFRNEGVGKFSLYELFKYYGPNITTIKLDSISPESDKFYKALKMQQNDEKVFLNDAMWLSNFMKSMTNENDIIKQIGLIHNSLYDKAL